jgi:pimeloyl-ACP methyl ester carboxylesterase
MVHSAHPSRRSLLASVFVAAGLLGASHSVPAQSVRAPSETAISARNIVLVHGAFTDGSGWKAVSDLLTREGYQVSITQPPETSLEEDVAATQRVLNRQDGPVVLVGHSYGGIVITEAGNNARVKALVYVAAFQPDAGESLASLGASKPRVSSSVAPSEGYLYVDPARFHADFAADLPASVADFMARSQVGLALKAAGAPVSNIAWKVKPSFAVVATEDRSINPELQRSMYKRSGALTTEIKGSHAIYISQPEAVAAVIRQAALAAK